MTTHWWREERPKRERVRVPVGMSDKSVEGEKKKREQEAVALNLTERDTTEKSWDAEKKSTKCGKYSEIKVSR